MKISIIGSGRIGLSLGSVLAQSGYKVFMTDKDLAKKKSVTGETLFFYEPELQDCIKKNQNSLEWTRYIEKIISSDLIFFCLNVPLNKAGDSDLTEVLDWTQLISENTKKEKLLIIKSTFPVGTNKKMQAIAKEKAVPLFVITCPEFLRQGQALKDISFPERLVIGSRDLKTGKKLEKFYKSFTKPKSIIHTEPETAELSKLACNSFLATKISFINELAGLCEHIKGDPKKLQLILGTDSRIGKDFLNPGLGYGGYCLPKDIQLAIREGQKTNQNMNLLKSVQQINDSLIDSFFQKIIQHYKNLKAIPLAFWGISFKKNTDDLKNSPALSLLCKLLKAGAEIHVYDPLFIKEKVFMFLKKSMENSQKQTFNLKNVFKGSTPQKEDQIKFLKQKILKGKVSFHKTALESLKDKQGLIIGSDCEEFKQIPLSEIKKELSKPFLMDSRNLFSIEDLKKEGFYFYQRGFSFIEKEKDI